MMIPPLRRRSQLFRFADRNRSHGAAEADSAETAARQAADTTFQNNIDAEATARAAADIVCRTISTLKPAVAQSAESTITTNLNNEVTRATAAETAEAADSRRCRCKPRRRHHGR